MTRTDQAFVTLATNDAYAVGALVLAESLREVGTTRQLVVMVTTQVSPPLRGELQSVFNNVVTVDILDSGDSANLALLARPELGLTFTKLHCWRLTQYDKCVFLDADTLVVQNVDELFDHDELAAVPDVGWPDCFNSGVFVFRPSQETYQSLLNFALTYGSFDGGDQGLLNAYFSDWSLQGPNKRLSFIYNTTAHAFYSYAPAFKRFGQNVKIVHFVGPVKPWHVGYNTNTGEIQAQGMQTSSANFINLWWRIFVSRLSHKLASKMSELGGGVTSEGVVVLGGAGTQSADHVHVDDSYRQYEWERGHIDYMGRDSFENILRQLDTKIVPANGQANEVRPVANGDAKASPATKLGTQKPIVFPKDSEFSKRSTDSSYLKAPERRLHRKKLRIPLKVYNQQVVTNGPGKASLAPTGKTSSKPAAEIKPTQVKETQPSTVSGKVESPSVQPTPSQPSKPQPAQPVPLASSALPAQAPVPHVVQPSAPPAQLHASEPVDSTLKATQLPASQPVEPVGKTTQLPASQPVEPVGKSAQLPATQPGLHQSPVSQQIDPFGKPSEPMSGKAMGQPIDPWSGEPVAQSFDPFGGPSVHLGGKGVVQPADPFGGPSAHLGGKPMAQSVDPFGGPSAHVGGKPMAQPVDPFGGPSAHLGGKPMAQPVDPFGGPSAHVGGKPMAQPVDPFGSPSAHLGAKPMTQPVDPLGGPSAQPVAPLAQPLMEPSGKTTVQPIQPTQPVEPIPPAAAGGMSERDEHQGRGGRKGGRRNKK